MYAGFACQISNTSEWKKSSIELAKVNLPNTAWKPAQKSLMVASTSSTVPPSVLMKRAAGIVAAISGVPSSTTASGPISSIASRMASAVSSSASSHEMRSQRPSPRSPARRSGCRRRSGESICRLHASPFWQIIGFMSGTPGSTVPSTAAASSNTTLPSFANT